MNVSVGTLRQPVAAASPRQRDRLFFSGMALAIAATVFAGFAPTYYLRSATLGPLPTLIAIHGALFTLWILVFVTQTSLIAARRVALHRMLGAAAVALMAAMVVAGWLAAVHSLRRGFAPPGAPSPLAFFIVPVSDLVLFVALAAAGLWFRRRPELHKRLMLLAAIGLLPPAIARVVRETGGGTLLFFGLTDLFVVACFAYDRLTRGRIHPAFLWGGLALILSQPLRMVIARTPQWLAFAEWAAR